MKTRERILATSLALLNEHGAPGVTTNQIALEMDISPGNLYYHFRRKEQIVAALFERYEARMDALLHTPGDREITMEDLWLFLHLLFEAIWEYRFLYRDLDYVVTRNERLRGRFRRLVDRTIETTGGLCRGLVDCGVMRADEEDVEALARNVTVLATYWLNFRNIYAGTWDDESAYLGQGVYQVLTLLSPFQTGEGRALLRRLAADYAS